MQDEINHCNYIHATRSSRCQVTRRCLLASVIVGCEPTSTCLPGRQLRRRPAPPLPNCPFGLPSCRKIGLFCARMFVIWCGQTCVQPCRSSAEGRPADIENMLSCLTPSSIRNLTLLVASSCAKLQATLKQDMSFARKSHARCFASTSAGDIESMLHVRAAPTHKHGCIIKCDCLKR